jgi:uncharacterized repeat protein (TIGR03803 family)
MCGCDGAVPAGGVVIGNGGVLYGTTQYGGTAGYGTIFSLTPPATDGGMWTETILHDFSFADGTNPSGSLSTGSGGVLYGTAQYDGNAACTSQGVALGCGTVFSLTPPATVGGAWTYTVLYAFTGTGDGAPPDPGGLIMDSSGMLYGTANSGGANTCIAGMFNGCSVVYSLSLPSTPSGPWTENVLSNTGALDFNQGLFSGIAIGFGLNGITIIYAPAYISNDQESGDIYSLSAPAVAGGTANEAVVYSFVNDETPAGSLAIASGVL